jgi:methylase of polypeptide subunit release factors
MDPERESRDDAVLTLLRSIRSAGYSFSTVTPLTNARVNARPANARAKDLAGVFGWSRPFEREVLAPELFEALQSAQELEASGDAWRSRIRVSTLSSKCFVHSAHPTLAPDAVFFGPDTVRFVRAIEQYLRAARPTIRRAVDIGCGAGPGAITVACYAPKAEVLMTDINPRALRFATLNAEFNGVSNAVAVESDILRDVEGEFDFIVANPPYLIDGSARAYRHGGGALGEGISIEILEQSLERLSKSGVLLLYTGVAIVDGRDLFREACAKRLPPEKYVWSYEEVDPDVFGEELMSAPYTAADRIAAVALTTSRTGKSVASARA